MRSEDREVLPSITKDVATWILRYATARRLPPGDRLPSEHAIARATRAGRTSVREALQRLIGQGFIYVRAGKGYYWRGRAERSAPLGDASLGVREIRELTEARLLLECECAAMAAVRATPDEVARIDAFLRKMERMASDVDAFAAAIELHLMIVGAAHNSALSEMAVVILPRLMAHGAELARELPDRVELQVAQHRALWIAIRSGNPDAARAAMAAHIRDSASVYLLPYESHQIFDRS